MIMSLYVFSAYTVLFALLIFHAITFIPHAFECRLTKEWLDGNRWWHKLTFWVTPKSPKITISLYECHQSNGINVKTKRERRSVCLICFFKYALVDVPSATVWCENKSCTSTSQLKTLTFWYLSPSIHKQSNGIKHGGHHIATLLTSLYFLSRLMPLTLFSFWLQIWAFFCDHSLRWKYTLCFPSFCYRLFVHSVKSFHFSYLMNKTVFALMDQLLTLCNHISHKNLYT